MTTVSSIDEMRTIGELLDRLGGIPADRVRLFPSPGTATVEDVVRIDAHEDRLCELIEGVLVEKPMGYKESALAGAILDALRAFVIPRNLGMVSGESGMMQIFPDLVRIPDVAYASWDRFPGRRLSEEAVPLLVPDIAVEVLSATNTPGEMKKKRHEYFDAGVTLLWIVDPPRRTVTVYTAPEEFVILDQGQKITGGIVLPGFEFSLATLFAELDRQG